MDLRRRVAPGNWDSLKRFDVYSKINDDYVTRTQSGGAVTLITFFVLFVLFLSELASYLTVEVVDHIHVDTTLNQKLHIGLNISFPHLRCDEISVDTVDSTGDNQVNIQGGLTKNYLDIDGSYSKGEFIPTAGNCYSCHGAESDTAACCNSCQDLRSAFKAKNMSYEFVVYEAEQCIRSVGCEVSGDVHVSKVGGNVHVALGKSTVRNGKHVHEFNVRDIDDGFNTSHTINRLDFGGENTDPEAAKALSSLMESPLSGSTKIVRHGSFMFHYYVKLVPTTFVSLSGERISTHQYAVTDNSKNVMVKKGELSGLPGVFLVYEFNPFMVEKRESRRAFTHFVTSVCAILGGVYTVASIVNSLISLGIFKVFGCGPQTRIEKL